MHDVGKMKVAGEILKAPRALTDSEWVVMRSHSLASEEIVSSHKVLRSFAPAVRSHHERLDGRGYPDGLVGSQITLATRIVTVADAFNAMIGRRAYRLPISPENALDRLLENRGRQFDPIVVEAMVSVVAHA
jgi:HD-GYP domain-containing protein (c-di-GMP phosphodiesterase class II)